MLPNLFILALRVRLYSIFGIISTSCADIVNGLANQQILSSITRKAQIFPRQPLKLLSLSVCSAQADRCLSSSDPQLTFYLFPIYCQ